MHLKLQKICKHNCKSIKRNPIVMTFLCCIILKVHNLNNVIVYSIHALQAVWHWIELKFCNRTLGKYIIAPITAKQLQIPMYNNSIEKYSTHETKLIFLGN